MISSTNLSLWFIDWNRWGHYFVIFQILWEHSSFIYKTLFWVSSLFKIYFIDPQLMKVCDKNFLNLGIHVLWIVNKWIILNIDILHFLYVTIPDRTVRLWDCRLWPSLESWCELWQLGLKFSQTLCGDITWQLAR